MSRSLAVFVGVGIASGKESVSPKAFSHVLALYDHSVEQQEVIIRSILPVEPRAGEGCKKNQDEFSTAAIELLLTYQRLGNRLEAALNSDDAIIHEATQGEQDIYKVKRAVEARARLSQDERFQVVKRVDQETAAPGQP